MEYFIAVVLIFALLVFMNIGKKAIERAKNLNLESIDQVVVSRAFYESACKVSELSNNSPSIQYKRQNLPRALHELEKEVIECKRCNAANEREAVVTQV